MKVFLKILKSCLIEVKEILVSSMISCRVRAGVNWSKTFLLMEDICMNLFVIFVSQNLFYTGKKGRTISFNSSYIVVFKNPRDQTQIRYRLALQMFPSKENFLQAAYEEEMKDPYRYLFLDFHQISPEFARVRGNIFPYDILERILRSHHSHCI